MNSIRLKAEKVSQHITDEISRHVPDLKAGEPTYVYVGENTNYRQETINWLFLYTLGAVDVPR